METQLFVQVPTKVIRNEGLYIDNGTFLLYVRLCFLYFRNFRNEEIKIDHKKLMLRLGIVDTRTLKKRLNELHKCQLIKNKVTEFPKRGEIIVLFNSEMVEGYFTQLNVKVFDQIHKINEHAFRLMFYYKSHINLDANKDFCFVGIETLKHNLKMSGTTIIEANTLLKKHKMIKVVKHKLEETGSYDENDELVIDKYNNHYYIKGEYI